MRIALTITELHPGGAETCFLNLAMYLQQRGHEVSVWQLWPAPPAGKRGIVDALDQHGINWKSGNAVHAWDFPSSAHWLRGQLRQFAPDVVQAFLFHANVATAYAVSGLARYGGDQPRPVPFFGGARVKQPQFVRRHLQRWASRRMDQLVCVSRGVAAHCRSVERIPEHKLCVIPNGIDLAQLPQQPAQWPQLGLPPDARVVLFVGRLSDQKGVLELARACPGLLDALPEHHMVWMGEGPLRPQLEQLVRQVDSPRLHLVGYQSQAPAWMQAAEMLVLPAKYEGMPNVVLEAMACQRPVVAFAVEGVRELLGTHSLAEPQIARPGDFADLTTKLQRLALDPHLRERCGRENRLRIEADFQLETQLQQYVQLYESHLKRDASPQGQP